MRVSRESLIRIAKETVQERTFNNRAIIAAYLTGALVQDDIDPLLGGTADIDIIFVHADEPRLRREFIKLTPDFHVDIGHRARAEFKRPRELRIDPWLGWEMYDPLLLYEREKFFEFLQAGLRAGFEFNAPAPALQRSRLLLAHGRQIWRDLLEAGDPVTPQDLAKYMKSLFHAVNAVAELSGPPLHERRLMLEFRLRAETAQRPGMTAGLAGLMGGNGLDPDQIRTWLPDWKLAFEAAAEKERVDNRIHRPLAPAPDLDPGCRCPARACCGCLALGRQPARLYPLRLRKPGGGPRPVYRRGRRPARRPRQGTRIGNVDQYIKLVVSLRAVGEAISL
jgi:predicted nucleotidyltransferase